MCRATVWEYVRSGSTEEALTERRGQPPELALGTTGRHD
jgi:hypothetical protein